MEASHITRRIIWDGEAVEVFLDPIPCGIPFYHVTISDASRIYLGQLKQSASGQWHYESNDGGELRREFKLQLLRLFGGTGADNCVFDIEAEDDLSEDAE
jgi:DNA-binding Xre family transcriptional regulator